METLVNILLFCAFLGMIWAFLEKLFDGASGFCSTVLSFFVKGLVWGVMLFGIMFVAKFLCLTNSKEIFGHHPFWVGFIAGTAVQLYQEVRNRFF